MSSVGISITTIIGIDELITSFSNPIKQLYQNEVSQYFTNDIFFSMILTASSILPLTLMIPYKLDKNYVKIKQIIWNGLIAYIVFFLCFILITALISISAIIDFVSYTISYYYFIKYSMDKHDVEFIQNVIHVPIGLLVFIIPFHFSKIKRIVLSLRSLMKNKKM